MNYLIIAYKPDSDDYCRGCHMASYSSGYGFINTTDRDKALRFLTDKMKYECDTGECGYDFDIFVNGKTCVSSGEGHTDEGLEAQFEYDDNPGIALRDEASVLAKKEIAEGETLRKQEEARKEAEKAAKSAREKEEKERRDYERLKAKFEGGANV